MARQVWKPLLCAEMPCMACIATGRPTIRSCRCPCVSVQGRSSTTGASKGRRRQLGGDPPDGGGRMPQRSATASGLYSGAV
ncbi:MAG: hypothetical protein R3D25_15515 [Geminicoccaceae bacterium]